MPMLTVRIFVFDVEHGTRWIDDGNVVTSAGFSAGVDMSLHLVRRLAGAELASATARQPNLERPRQSQR